MPACPGRKRLASTRPHPFPGVLLSRVTLLWPQSWQYGSGLSQGQVYNRAAIAFSRGQEAQVALGGQEEEVGICPWKAEVW